MMRTYCAGTHEHMAANHYTTHMWYIVLGGICTREYHATHIECLGAKCEGGSQTDDAVWMVTKDVVAARVL